MGRHRHLDVFDLAHGEGQYLLGTGSTHDALVWPHHHGVDTHSTCVGRQKGGRVLLVVEREGGGVLVCVIECVSKGFITMALMLTPPSGGRGEGRGG